MFSLCIAEYINQAVSLKVLQKTAIIFFVALFLADAINLDELFGSSAIRHEDETSVVDQSSSEAAVPVTGLQLPIRFSGFPRTPAKVRLELIDVDSPSLEAAYVSRDEVAPLVLAARTPIVPPSAQTEPSFYSLCKLQI